MSMKKIAALLLALLILSTAAVAETIGTIGAPEGAEATEKPEIDLNTVIAEFGDTQITINDAMPAFMSNYQTLANYGFDMSAYVPYIKQQVLAQLVQREIEKQKTAELGLDQFTEEELAELEADANATYQEMFDYYLPNFTYNNSENPTGDTTEFLANYGYTPESVFERAKQSAATDKLVAQVTADLEVTDETLRQYYEDAVAEDQAAYESDISAYESARSGDDDVVLWNPEGFRRVKQVLIALDSDGRSRYQSLTRELDKINKGEASEMTLEEAQQEIDSLLAPLYETAAEVSEKFAAGTDIEELIADYGGDPGMNAEPTKTEGYYVSADSTVWDSAFVDAAMSLTETGTLSEPYPGMFGLYLVYYLADVPAGAVPYEDVQAALDEQCRAEAVRSAYYDQLTKWSDELGVQFYMDRFVTELDG